jgi:anti-sigma B factor antagonist
VAAHTARVVDDLCIVALSGEIDMSSAGDLEKWLRDAIRDSGCSRLEVDLTDLDFLDSFGIRAMLRGKEFADEMGVDFVATHPNRLIERILRTLGLFEHLTAS